MKTKISLKRMILLIILAWLLSACGQAAAMTNVRNTDSVINKTPAATATTQPEKIVSFGTPLPTETALENLEEINTNDIPSARGGFIVFNNQAEEFQAYLPDGRMAYKIPAAGIKYPSPFTTSVVNGAVYYLTQTGETFVRATPESVKVIDIPANFMSKLAVSDDEKFIAWSMFDPNGSSSLWVAQMDADHNVIDSREVVRYSAEQSEAFNISPIAWTADGRLLFERGLTGIGGYILYGGHNSLYSYDPAVAELITLVPAEEMHGLCLESYDPDQEKILFNCSKEGPIIGIRDLKDDFADQQIPLLPNQGAAGSAYFSPSGNFLAYAIARSNPENESGDVVVVPADLSRAPTTITSVAENSYPVVLGWLDEETLLFSRSQWPDSSVWIVRLDGSDLQQMAAGWFMGWIR